MEHFLTVMEIKVRPLGCMLLLSFAVPASAEAPDERLEADHAVWSEARASYDQKVERGGIDATEKQDYEAFLADLRQRVAAGCTEVRDLGRPIPAGVECPEGDGIGGGVVNVAPSSATTRTEGREALDAELGTSLGQFDELLLREQDRVRAARPLSDAPSGGGGGGAASSASEDGDGDGESGSASASTAGSTGSGSTPGSETADGTSASATGQGGAGTLPPWLSDGRGEDDVESDGGSRQGDPGQAGRGPSSGQDGAPTRPADLPSPDGDDVVARQLREAAERERDPELKARLWDEYRRYRGGTR